MVADLYSAHYNILLQNATDIITKYDSYLITKCDNYFITKYNSGNTNCDSYYKMRRLLQTVSAQTFTIFLIDLQNHKQIREIFCIIFN